MERHWRNGLESNTVSISLDTDFARALQEVVADWGQGSRGRDELLAALMALQAEAEATEEFGMLVLVGLAWRKLAGIPYGAIPERLAA